MAFNTSCPSCSKSILPSNNTPVLQRLCEQNRYEEICEFMASGNNVNILLYPIYTSPLHIAAKAGSKETVLTLLGHGAFPNILNLEKRSPFHEVKYI